MSVLSGITPEDWIREQLERRDGPLPPSELLMPDKQPDLGVIDVAGKTPEEREDVENEQRAVFAEKVEDHGFDVDTLASWPTATALIKTGGLPFVLTKDKIVGERSWRSLLALAASMSLAGWRSSSFPTGSIMSTSSLIGAHPKPDRRERNAELPVPPSNRHRHRPADGYGQAGPQR